VQVSCSSLADLGPCIYTHFALLLRHCRCYDILQEETVLIESQWLCKLQNVQQD